MKYYCPTCCKICCDRQAVVPQTLHIFTCGGGSSPLPGGDTTLTTNDGFNWTFTDGGRPRVDYLFYCMGDPALPMQPIITVGGLGYGMATTTFHCGDPLGGCESLFGAFGLISGTGHTIYCAVAPLAANAVVCCPFSIPDTIHATLSGTLTGWTLPQTRALTRFEESTFLGTFTDNGAVNHQCQFLWAPTNANCSFGLPFTNWRVTFDSLSIGAATSDTCSPLDVVFPVNSGVATLEVTL
jgi:hypothetical protein